MSRKPPPKKGGGQQGGQQGGQKGGGNQPKGNLPIRIGQPPEVIAQMAIADLIANPEAKKKFLALVAEMGWIDGLDAPKTVNLSCKSVQILITKGGVNNGDHEEFPIVEAHVGKPDDVKCQKCAAVLRGRSKLRETLSAWGASVSGDTGNGS